MIEKKLLEVNPCLKERERRKALTIKAWFI